MDAAAEPPWMGLRRVAKIITAIQPYLMVIIKLRHYQIFLIDNC